MRYTRTRNVPCALDFLCAFVTALLAVAVVAVITVICAVIAIAANLIVLCLRVRPTRRSRTLVITQMYLAFFQLENFLYQKPQCCVLGLHLQQGK